MPLIAPIRQNAPAFAWLLGVLAALPALAIDLNQPALPPMATSLGVSVADAALTISDFMLGFGLAQLVVGPAADRFGRRPVLIGGLTLFTAGSLACVFAPSFGVLLTARLLQGAGAATGNVLAFAISRDVFSGDALRAKLSGLTMTASVAPLVAPTLGAFLLGVVGWRGTFATLAVGAACTLAAASLGFVETMRTRSRALSPGAGLISAYLTVLRTRRTTAFVLVNACNFGGSFGYIGAASLLLLGTYGLSTHAYALLFALIASGIMAGATISKHAARRGVPARVPLRMALGIAVATSAASVAITLDGTPPLVTLMPLLFLYLSARGIVGPGATHAALENLPDVAGTASATLGCTQILVGSASTAFIALLYPRFGPLALTLTMLGFAVAEALAYLLTEGQAMPSPAYPD